MSVYATTWAWEQPTANPGQRLVLLAMADNAAGPDTDEPGICWPSVELIAAKCQLSTRQVKRHLADLHESGLVIKMERRRRRDGSFSVWEYLVPYQGTPTAPGEQARGHPRSSPGDTHGMDQGTPMSPQEEPSCEPSVEPSPSSSTSAEVERVDPWERAFNDWYSTYPKKVGRLPASKAFKSKLKGMSHGQMVQLSAGSLAWQRFWSEDGTAMKYIPYPATFLNREQYNDEPPPVASSQPKPNSPMGILKAIAERDHQ